MPKVVDIPSARDGLPVKQRLFARYVAHGLSKRDAAEKAGYKPGGNASDVGYKLAKLPKVQAEISRVSAENEREERVSLAQHVARMEELSKEAQDAGQFSAAIQAAHYAGRVSRLYVEQSHVVSESVDDPHDVLERLNAIVGTNEPPRA